MHFAISMLRCSCTILLYCGSYCLLIHTCTKLIHCHRLGSTHRLQTSLLAHGTPLCLHACDRLPCIIIVWLCIINFCVYHVYLVAVSFTLSYLCRMWFVVLEIGTSYVIIECGSLYRPCGSLVTPFGRGRAYVSLFLSLWKLCRESVVELLKDMWVCKRIRSAKLCDNANGPFSSGVSTK